MMYLYLLRTIIYPQLFNSHSIIYFNIIIHYYIKAISIIIYIKCDIVYDYNNYYIDNSK